jgi:hypothetical protein
MFIGGVSVAPKISQVLGELTDIIEMENSKVHKSKQLLRSK